MLMRLGRWLRLLGQDVANPEGSSDDELLSQARKENRTIITRDRELFRPAGVRVSSACSSAPPRFPISSWRWPRRASPCSSIPRGARSATLFCRKSNPNSRGNGSVPSARSSTGREVTGRRWKRCWRAFVPEKMRMSGRIPERLAKRWKPWFKQGLNLSAATQMAQLH